ncbi:MAG TPA: tetratricopeptide repeat protein, partial [Terracidiphilus sp.]|nr:tetratricopeptide repeat protein [Terracidiphilus sp.]
MAGAAVAAAPTMETAWVALGQAWKVAGRNGEAERAYREAIRLNGRSALARMGLGELLLAAGDPESALCEYGVALQRSPALPALWVSMGHALACMEKNAEALESYEKALSFAPRAAEAEFGC